MAAATSSGGGGSTGSTSAPTYRHTAAVTGRAGSRMSGSGTDWTWTDVFGKTTCKVRNALGGSSAESVSSIENSGEGSLFSRTCRMTLMMASYASGTIPSHGRPEQVLASTVAA